MKNTVKLNAGIVISRNDITNATAAELSTFMNDAIQEGKVVRVVDNITNFFSAKNFEAALAVVDTMAIKMIAEKQKVELNTDQLNALVDHNTYFNLARVDLISGFKEALNANKPDYVFAVVPDDWNIDTHLKISKVSVRRIIGSGYSIGLKNTEKLWKLASAYWAEKSVKRSITLDICNSSRACRVNSNVITIGCQEINRFEIEQLAIRMGWEFPTNESVDIEIESV